MVPADRNAKPNRQDHKQERQKQADKMKQEKCDNGGKWRRLGRHGFSRRGHVRETWLLETAKAVFKPVDQWTMRKISNFCCKCGGAVACLTSASSSAVSVDEAGRREGASWIIIGSFVQLKMSTKTWSALLSHFSLDNHCLGKEKHRVQTVPLVHVLKDQMAA